MLSTCVCMQSMVWKMGWLSWRESGMCRWRLHPHPALVSDPCPVVPRESIIPAHNADTAKAPSCICSITEFFLWVCHCPRLLDFRGHCGSHNRIFIYRTWMKFCKSLLSITNSSGLKYFLCVVFKDCQDTELGMRFLHVHSRTQHTRDNFSLMPLCISKTWQHITPSPA